MPVWSKSDSGHRWSACRWPALYPCGAPASRPDVAGRPGGGFTLLELLLVLAILGIVSAVAMPRYGRAAGRYRADVAARRVAADLRLAQAWAKQVSAARTVTFSTAAGQYQLLGVAPLDGRTGDYTVVLSAEPYRAVLVSANFNGSAQVVFNGWGLPNSGGTVVISAGAEQRTITLDGTSGKVSLQ